MSQAQIEHLPISDGGTTRIVVGAEDAPAQGDSEPCRLVWLRARGVNSADVRLAFAEAALDDDGGFELAPGEQFGPMPLRNVNQVWVGGTAGDAVDVLFAL